MHFTTGNVIMSLKALAQKSIRPAKLFFNNKRNKTLLHALSALPTGNTGVTLIDIGAEGDIEPRWKRIEPFLNYVGFEPDERSRSLLLQKGNNCLNYQLLPFAVWDIDGSIGFNLGRSPGTSSHYLPNQPFIDLFPDPRRYDVVETTNLKTTTLDNLALKSADFIKIDIQGGELNALRGGQTLLKIALGLEIEVEFIALYKNQPLFGEICAFLSGFEFEFIDFVNLCRWERLQHNSYGQCVFGDALFLRSPEYILKTSLNSESVSKYLSICLIYNRFDLIDRMISLLPHDLKKTYADFRTGIEPIRKSNKVVRIFNRLAGSVFTLFGVEHRAHLLY